MWIANYAQSILEEMDADRISASYYAERIEAGVISYAEVVLSLIPSASSIRNRLPGLIHGFPGSLWADEKHKTRMEVFNNRLGFIKSRNTPSYYAALYLLTSNDALYRRTANCFYHGGIDFSYAVLRGISPHNYALLYAAKGLHHAGGVTESELADPMTIDDEAFRLIIAGHTGGCDHQNAMGLKAVEQEVGDGRQGDDRLAESHIQQDS